MQPLVKELPVVGEFLGDSCELSIIAAFAVVFGFLAVVGKRHVAAQSRKLHGHRGGQRNPLVGRAEHHVEFDAAGQQGFCIELRQSTQLGTVVKKTGVDSLAISIGTSHGAFKFKLKEGEEAPPLRFDILEEVEKRIPGFPIVLHGASSVVQDYVALINQYGGKMEGAIGVSEEQLRRAAKSSVCKINIDSDGRLVVTAKVREFLANNPGEFDPRKYLGAARKELITLLIHKNKTVLGSAGKA